jgi:L-histidine N-alpha-methyltransferase
VPELLLERADDFLASVIGGLSQPQKTIPARFFYDRRGSELFEEITRLAEYYPTRTEISLLKAHAAEIAHFTRHGKTIVEFGSGSSTKTPLLLAAVQPQAYVPIDISSDFLEQSAAALASEHSGLNVVPIAGDFSLPLDLPALPGPFTGFFPGSTVGNFPPPAAIDLLRSFRATLGSDASLVIGLDLRKNQRLIEAAYDDSDGVTAAFNLNLLDRINRELDGTIPVDAFEHRAVWHDGKGRIEMHLQASCAVEFSVDGHDFAMREGETIHTENSYKYTMDEARLMARASGWEPMVHWIDVDGLFSLHVWQAAEDRLEP